MKKKCSKWWGLISIAPATAMIFTDQSVLPVALPTIQQHLGASNVALQWCVNSYLLSMAVFSLICGKMGDRIGPRLAFTLGMIIFVIASFFCGLSPNVWDLIVWRGVQGLGAAFMIPATPTLMAALFPPNERGRAIGLNVSIGSLFLISAPLIGGYFTEMFSWRWIFWMNIPIAAIGLFLNYLFLPKIEKGKGIFDYLGFVFFFITCSFFVTALMQGREWGWDSYRVIAMFIISIISGYLMFWREKKAKHPFLDLSLFRITVFKAVNISIFFTSFILMISVFRAIYFQDVLDWSPLKVGTIMIIASSPVMFTSTIGGILSDRFGPKLPISLGFILMIYSFFWIALFSQSSLWMLFIGLLIFSFGVPMVFTPSYSSATQIIPPKKLGIAFGTISTIRSIGATLGVAIIGAFIDNIQYSSFKKQILQDPATSMLDPYNLEGLATGVERSADLSGVSSSKLKIIMAHLKQSQVLGFEASHIALGLILIAVFAIVFIFYHKKSQHKLPEAPAEGWD